MRIIFYRRLWSVYSLRRPIIVINIFLYFLSYFKLGNVVLVTMLRPCLPFCDQVRSASCSSRCPVSTGGLVLVLKLPVPDNCVPVTTVWLVLRWRIEERPTIWRVVANILNKQSRTAEMGLSFSLGVGRGANNSLP